MSGIPWPTTPTKSVLFVLDASHAVDQGLLETWLEKEKAASDFAGSSARVVVPIARSPESIRVEGLARALDVSAEEVSADTLVVPLRVVWQTSLDTKGATPRLRDLLRGNPRRPGRWRARGILSRHPERALCIAAEPATLGALRDQATARRGEAPNRMQFARFVAGRAGLALDLAERRLRGSRYKVPRRVAQNLQSSARFNTALRALSKEIGQPIEALQTESATIMKELIAIPRTFWLDVLGMLNRVIISLGYEAKIVTNDADIARIRQITRENPAAILWTHKTHVDGFAINSVLFENDFPAPHILGGVNMAFGGLGFVARRAGAIFIRRSFQDNPLYKMILRQYIGYLLEKRFPLSWAFEGTRSRVGKLMPPRYGLLKYVVEAAHSTGARNLHIIPVAINYDLIGDVADYTLQESGAVKRPESLSWFVGYLRGLRQPLGQIYIDFGEPVVLEDPPSAEDPLVLSKIAFQVGVEANRMTPITLASLGSMILLGAAPRALTNDELVEEMTKHVLWAKERGIRMTSHFELENVGEFAALSRVLLASGPIKRYDEGPERLFGIAPEDHAEAGYYRNTTIHYFVNKAIAELALLQVAQVQATQPETLTDDAPKIFWQEAERLRDLFKFEFFYAPTEEFRDEVREELFRYEPEWEASLANDPSVAQTLLAGFTPLVAHSTLLSFIEAYRIVSDVVARLEPGASIDEKDCTAQALVYSRQAYLQRRISSQASIGRLLFQNGHKLLTNRGLTEGGDADHAKQRQEMSQNFRELAHRLERIRTLALPT
jgi:glycerol-3-phosphate O-acyltransferase